MKLIRKLKPSVLYKAIKVKQPNGIYTKEFEKIDDYNVEVNNLTDEVSATIYGANIDNMLNIDDSLGNLYKYLNPKVENESDNISLYYIEIDGTKYKIKSVKESGIIIERL